MSKVKYRLLFNILAAWGVLLFTAKNLAQSSNVSNSIQQVRVLTASNQLSQVQEKLIPQLKAIYSTTTDTSEKLQILNCVAENSLVHKDNSDENRYLLLKYATDEFASLESSNKTSVWASDFLGRFVKGESSDLYKAYALSNLVVLQVLGRDQRSARRTLEDLLHLMHSSQDPQLAKQHITILTEAIGDYSEGIETPEDQAAWVKSLQNSLQDTNNSFEDRCIFTMAIGDIYSDDGVEDKVKAAKNLFLQAMQGTTNMEQKLECLHMISYCCFQLTDYPGSIAAIEEMIPMVASLQSESRSAGVQILGQAVWSAENAFKQEKKWNRLIEIREMVLDQSGKDIPPGEVFYFSVENGRDAKMAGSTKDAITWYDRAIKIYPSSGWEDSDYEPLKGAGWSDSAIVNLNLEKVNIYDPTNHLERIKMMEAIWNKYGSNEWNTTYNLGVNLAFEYYAVKDKRGKQLLSDLVTRMGSSPPSQVEESCLIKLALWYGEDKEVDKMKATLKIYLVKYPNGNNALTAKTLLTGKTVEDVSPKEESARRMIVLVVLALFTVVPLVFITTRKILHPNKSA
jgi:tetratricopeptide (TPR) repeat protein